MSSRNESGLSDVEVRELIEYRDTFGKFLEVEANKVRANLWSGNYNWKEQEAYLTISVLKSIVNGLDKLQKNYTRMLEDAKKEKNKPNK